MESAIGQTFGAYRIESLLASGVSASLYRATRTDQTEPVAVKIIDPTFVESPERRKEVLARASRAQDLLHPNLLEIRDFGQEHSLCYLVMEFCPHGSARTLLRRARGTGQALPVGLCLDLIRQAADAAAFLTTNGINLTKLQTGNLLLRASSGGAGVGRWTVKLDPVEVPLLPIVGPVLSSVDDQATRGSTPERASIERLGAVLFELLTGAAPENQTEPRFVPPSVNRPGLAPDVDDIVRRCLDDKSDDRFDTVSTLIEAIELQLLRTESVAPDSTGGHLEPESDESLSVEVRHLGRRGSRQRVYQIELRNESTSVKHVSMHARDDHDELRYQFSPEMVTVEPHRARTIVLTVSDKRRRGDPGHIAFMVVATQANGFAIPSPALYERVATREFNARQALAGFGALGVIAVVLLAVMFGTMLRSATPDATPTATAGPIAVASTPTAAPTPSPPPRPTTTPTPTSPPSTPTPTVALTTATPMTVRRIDTTTNRVALTFSISNDPESATKVSQILRILSARNVHATFGLRGDWAKANPGLVKAIVSGGHQIINETYDHRSFTGVSQRTGPLPSADRVDELAQADRAVQQVSGYEMRPYYRPPFGDMELSDGTSIAPDAARAGYSVAVLWSIDTKSWSTAQSVGHMISDASAAQPGDIILFSITSAGASKDISALPQVIDNLQTRGRGFATIEELVGR